MIRSLEQLRRLVEVAGEELSAANQALSKLQEEARRAGVPSGVVTVEIPVVRSGFSAGANVLEGSFDDARAAESGLVPSLVFKGSIGWPLVGVSVPTCR